ncbi:hypothetical protein S40288_05246 [Stachybotrys chartarum IBT 40288]|nr:hypothetical protein S40288_05246 [Stachybotrys chartarum IBT 40288]
MGFSKALVAAAAALSFVQVTSAWNIEMPPCLDPFKPFVYSGCYQNTSPDQLIYRSSQSSQNMTVEKCVSECKGNGFRYAGLAYYGVCFCGPTVNGAALEDSQCSFPCNGDKSQTCGGNNIVSVYQDPTFSADSDSVTTDNYVPLGCYTDQGAAGRSLSWPKRIDAATFTTDSCLSACKQDGFPFAGTEYGRECYCGSVLANHTVPAPAAECNMPCQGDASDTCGGRSRLNVYVAKELESLEPCGYEPPSNGGSSSSSATEPTVTTSVVPGTTSVPAVTTTSVPSVPDTTTSVPSVPDTTTVPSVPGTTSSSSSSSSSVNTDQVPVTTTTRVPSTTTASICTATVTPPSECEYKCGKWCLPSLPDFEDDESCLGAWKTCAKQVTSCFKYAGFPGALECLEFSKWCGKIQSFCKSDDCKRGRGKGKRTFSNKKCSKKSCFDKFTPKNPNPPKPPTTSVFPCPPATTVVTSTVVPTTAAPEPTNICKQPTNSKHDYAPGNPVGGIELPLVGCNDIKQDFFSNPFKLYTEQDSRRCRAYTRPKCANACADACQEQYEECKETYVESCNPKHKGQWWWKKRDVSETLDRRTFGLWSNLLGNLLGNKNDGKDTPSKANERCTAQYKDCLAQNKFVNADNRCKAWGSGL